MNKCIKKYLEGGVFFLASTLVDLNFFFSKKKKSVTLVCIIQLYIEDVTTKSQVKRKFIVITVMTTYPSRMLIVLQSDESTVISSYDHLVRVLTRVMDERPENAVDVIEEMSHKVKRSMLQEKQSTLRDVPLTTFSELLAEKQRALFHCRDESEHEEVLVRRVCFQGDSMIAVAFSPWNFFVSSWNIKGRDLFALFVFLLDGDAPAQCD